MSWLYAHSSTWRRIVDFTQRSPLHMVGFAVACFALPAYVGDRVMERTNGAHAESKLELELRTRSSVDSQMLARAQKERLQVLLEEVRDGKGATRYQAALDGQSLGTHSRGTTVGAVAIKKS